MKSALALDDAKDLVVSDLFDLEGAYVEALRTTVRDDRRGHFHPSGVGGCGRKNVYEYLRYPFIETTDPASLETFDLGHAIHGLVGRRLADIERALKPKRIGYQLRTEVPYDPATDRLFHELDIVGTTDALLEIWADDWQQNLVVEIKSINEKQFDKLGGAAKEDHLMQVHLYAYRFNRPAGYVWYFCKNNSKRLVVPFVFSDTVFKAAIAKYTHWHDHVVAGTLPDREEDFYMCPRCEYREVCQPDIVKSRDDRNMVPVANLRKRGKL